MEFLHVMAASWKAHICSKHQQAACYWHATLHTNVFNRHKPNLTQVLLNCNNLGHEAARDQRREKLSICLMRPLGNIFSQASLVP